MSTTHDELVSELVHVEKMQLHERLKLAKKRRAQQLKAYNQQEKQYARQQQQQQQLASNQLQYKLSNDGNKSKKSLIGSSTLNGLISGSGAGSIMRKKQMNTTKMESQNSGRQRRLRFAESVLLLDATIRNDIAEVRYLLDQDVFIDSCTDDGLTALHQGCIENLEDMVRLLVERGANVNAQDSEMWTPLHAAATCGHLRICRYLCDRGADLLAVNSDGNMPYDLCEDGPTLDFIESEMSKRGVTQELIDDTRTIPENNMLRDLQNIVNAGGSINSRGPAGETPLHVAACCGYLVVAEFLLSRQHVAVNSRDNDDWQPIHCAACWGQLAVMALLIDHGADIDSKTRNGENVLDLCEDIDTKQRIVSLIDQAHKRQTRWPRPLVTPQRRHSSSRRGSAVMATLPCIRRSSVHEKTSLTAKDMREEAIQAMRLQQSMLTLDDEDDEEEQVFPAITVQPPQLEEQLDAQSDVRTSLIDTGDNCTKQVFRGASTTSTTSTIDSSTVVTPVTMEDTTPSTVHTIVIGDDSITSNDVPDYTVNTTTPSSTNSRSTTLSPLNTSQLRPSAATLRGANSIRSSSQAKSSTTSITSHSPSMPSFNQRVSPESAFFSRSPSSSPAVPLVQDETGNGSLTRDCRQQTEPQKRIEHSTPTNTLTDLKKQRSKLLQQQLLDRASGGRRSHNNGTTSTELGTSDSDIWASINDKSIFDHNDDVPKVVADITPLSLAEIYGNAKNGRGKFVGNGTGGGQNGPNVRHGAQDKCCIVT